MAPGGSVGPLLAVGLVDERRRGIGDRGDPEGAVHPDGVLLAAAQEHVGHPAADTDTEQGGDLRGQHDAGGGGEGRQLPRHHRQHVLGEARAVDAALDAVGDERVVDLAPDDRQAGQADVGVVGDGAGQRPQSPDRLHDRQAWSAPGTFTSTSLAWMRSGTAAGPRRRPCPGQGGEATAPSTPPSNCDGDRLAPGGAQHRPPHTSGWPCPMLRSTGARGARPPVPSLCSRGIRRRGAWHETGWRAGTPPGAWSTWRGAGRPAAVTNPCLRWPAG